MSVGDASVEGTVGARTMRFPITRSSPPGTGQSVTLAISILADAVSEEAEPLSIVVDSATDAPILKGTGVVTICDDD